MRTNDPAPSMSSLISSWLSLTGWMVSVCADRANTFVEGGHDRVGDAVNDVGCPPAERTDNRTELPEIAPEAFAAGLRQRADLALRQAAELINQEPNACMEAVTRDRVLGLFRALAEDVLAQAMEQRIAAAECERGEAEAPDWVRRYRRILAAEGRWPPAPEEEAAEESPGEVPAEAAAP